MLLIVILYLWSLTDLKVHSKLEKIYVGHDLIFATIYIEFFLIQLYSWYWSWETLITSVWQGTETDVSLHGAPHCLDDSHNTLGHLRVPIVRSGGPFSCLYKEVWICKITGWLQCSPSASSLTHLCIQEQIWGHVYGRDSGVQPTGSCPLPSQRLAPFISQGSVKGTLYQ